MEPAYHGGAFWDRLGDTFPTNPPTVVATDVLDAWFDPPAELLSELTQALPMLVRTSPPVHAEGVRRVIAEARGVPEEAVIVADGSSRLIHLVLQTYVQPQDTVLLLEPTYSEYRFVCERQRAIVHEHVLDPGTGFQWDGHSWLKQVQELQPAMAVLVRPNNPTGTQVDIAEVIDQIPTSTCVVVDETYLEYTDLDSLESLAVTRPNLVVIKSLSKVYGLSGIRLAYAVTDPQQAARFRAQMPPWSVSAPAQWFGCKVWDHQDYYRSKIAETHGLRREFLEALVTLPGKVLADCANWVLFEYESEQVNAQVVPRLRERDVFVRDASKTARTLSDCTLRIAVRPRDEQARILDALKQVLG